MGANPTQAQGVVSVLHRVCVLIAAGLAADVNYHRAHRSAFASLGASVVLFLKCKPWEHNEE